MAEADTMAAAEAAAATVAEAVAREEGPLTPAKRRIVETAVLVFAEKGYAAATTREIARRAGVSEAAIFRHFPTKQDLLLRLVQPLARHVVVPSGIEEFRAAAADGADAEAVLRRVLGSRLAFLRRFSPIARILAQELPFQPELQATLRAQLPVVRAHIGALVEAEIAAGRMRPVAVDQAMRWVATMLFGYFLISDSLAAEGGWDDEAEIAAMAAFAVRGLAP